MAETTQTVTVVEAPKLKKQRRFPKTVWRIVLIDTVGEAKELYRRKRKTRVRKSRFGDPLKAAEAVSSYLGVYKPKRRRNRGIEQVGENVFRADRRAAKKRARTEDDAG